MSTIIDPSDRRTAKALEILTTSGQWLKCRDKNGRPAAFGVPSQADRNHYYLTTTRRCTCKAFEYDGDCKHRMAAALHVASVRYQMVGK